MESCLLMVTFESVDEIPKYHIQMKAPVGNTCLPRFYVYA